MIFDDTIAAIATAPAMGAIGIIRISGKQAISISNDIFEGKNLLKVPTHTIHYGFIKNQNQILDEVMVSVFKAPKSFTTEDMVEINCHGSPFILQSILKLLIEKNVRLATPGEFTQRAFLNGRLDLSQAEAVADLIESENQSQQHLAIQQLKGKVSDSITELREQLIHFLAMIELELDFGEEDVEFANRKELIALLDALELKIIELKISFEFGNAIKNGVPVAIIGKPNSGKSTLLNALLNDERAIVSPVAGTTRDTIEEILQINGMAFRIIDTAGLRDTIDYVEQIGIKKTNEKIKEAKIVMMLIDGKNEDLQTFDIFEFGSAQANQKWIYILNKADLLSQEQIEQWKQKLPKDQIIISAKHFSNTELEALKQNLYSSIQSTKPQGNIVISNMRHFDALKIAEEGILNAKSILHQNLSGELISFELKQTIKGLGLITGKIEQDKDILGTIFGKFCIGK